jgi:hypothetical protein
MKLLRKIVVSFGVVFEGRGFEGRGCFCLPVAYVSLDGFGDLVLAGELQAGGDGDGVLDGLSGTVTGGRQESVCGVTDLDHALGGRGPGELRVTPEELEVYDGVGRGDLYKLLEHGRPLVGTRHLIKALDDFFGADVVAPGLGGGLVCLESVSVCILSEINADNLRRGSRSRSWCPGG